MCYLFSDAEVKSGVHNGGMEEKEMYLNDRLQICLLALASRYPYHVVDINEAVLGSQNFGAVGWTAFNVIELLEQVMPDLLQAMAFLVVDPHKSEIYLLDYSEKIPAIYIHCRGRIPLSEGDMSSRRIALAARA